MSDAKTIFKDLVFGVCIGAVLAVIVIRAIELGARSYVAATEVQAEEWLSARSPCESGHLVF